MDKKQYQKEYQKQYRLTHKNETRASIKRWNEQNPGKYKERIKKYNEKYWIDNKEKLQKLGRPKSQQYYLLNKEKIKKRNKENRELRKANNPLFKLSCNIRSLVCNSFKNQYTTKSKKTTEILGCSFEKFKSHLEKQFDENMNWNNFGSYWEMDHVKPVSLAKTEQELLELNHYTNLRPLEKSLNRRKGDSYGI